MLYQLWFMIVIIGQSLLILYSLGVSLSGLLSTHACLLATVRILLRSSWGSLFELLEDCSRREGGLSSGLLAGRRILRFPVSWIGEGIYKVYCYAYSYLQTRQIPTIYNSNIHTDLQYWWLMSHNTKLLFRKWENRSESTYLICHTWQASSTRYSVPTQYFTIY